MIPHIQDINVDFVSEMSTRQQQLRLISIFDMMQTNDVRIMLPDV
jgi:hypothetical protein